MKIQLENTYIVNNIIVSFKKQERYTSSAKKTYWSRDQNTTISYFTKIHKRNIPGKLAVSLAVDHYLKPHVEALPSYINDTADFININKINEA